MLIQQVILHILTLAIAILMVFLHLGHDLLVQGFSFRDTIPYVRRKFNRDPKRWIQTALGLFVILSILVKLIEFAIVATLG